MRSNTSFKSSDVQLRGETLSPPEQKSQRICGLSAFQVGRMHKCDKTQLRAKKKNTTLHVPKTGELSEIGLQMHWR